MNLNWLSFLTIIGTGYLCYYAALIITDAMFTREIASEKNEIPELTFSEYRPPEKVSLSDFASSPARDLQEPASKGLGGVPIQKIFELARQEAIQYTRSVSF